MQDLAKRWLKSLRTLISAPQSRPNRRARAATRLLFEALETRLAPAVITTIAGNGSYGYAGDGGSATSAMLYLPSATAVDSSGNVFIADTYNSRIREVVKATGNIITVAGSGSTTFYGDGGPAIYAGIARPNGVAVDSSGNIYIADTYNNRIREVVKATGNIITIAGNGNIGSSGDGGPATSASINYAFGVAVDSSGNVFFADQGNNKIREIVKATGTIITVAGVGGGGGYNGDNIPATSAYLNQPNGVAVDASGNIFISDWHNSRIREVVKATGQIITVAGNGAVGFTGDNGPATSARLYYPGGVAVDGAGNIFIGDASNNRIRAVDKATGVITTIAGTGVSGFSGDGGPATSAQIYLPYGLSVDASGNVYFADFDNHRVRAILNTPTLGTLSTTAWTVNRPAYSGTVAITGGAAPYSNLSATGLPAGLTAAVSGSTISLSGTPTAAGTYGSVTLSVQDAGGAVASRTFSITINATPALGTLSTTQWTAQVSGYTGAIPVSGGTAPLTIASQANLPPGLSATISGTSVTFAGIPTTTGTYSNVQLTVRDAAGATASGTFSIIINAPLPGSMLTIAGNWPYSGYNGDGGPANQASLNQPWAVAVDSSGNIYIADFYNSRVREIVKATGNIITIAGTGVTGYSGDGGPATAAKLYWPTGVAVDASGNVFIADLYNGRIREVVKATGNIITVAGNGGYTDTGDGGLAIYAGIASPKSVAVDASGNIFIGEGSSNRVREVVKATGNIITVAGTGANGFSGDGGPATAAMLYDPEGVAVDASGNLFIADSGNQRIREVVKATGNIITVAGNGSAGYSGDGGPATSAKLYGPYSVAVDASGNLYIADVSNSRIREVVQSSGSIVTVAGSGTAGYSGDGGPATSAKLYNAYGVAVDGSGNVFIADSYNNAIREALVIPMPVLGPLSVTAWTVNQPGYSGTIPITNVAPPPDAFVTASGLPAGLSVALSGATIIVSGTPTATGVYGSINVTLRGVSGAPLATRNYSMTINVAPSLGTLGFPTQWTVGRPNYVGAIPTSGGTDALTVSSQVNMPPGLTATMVSTLVTFTGTPTATGTYSNVQLTVRDAAGATSTGTYTITINPAPTLGWPSRTGWTANQPGFSSTVSVLGGTAPIANLTATGLPPGLSALQSGNTITISGTPTTAGLYNNIHLSVQDYAGATASGNFSLFITGPAVTFTILSDPTAMTAGTSGYFTVRARDASGNVAVGYQGTVSLGSSDPAAVLPASYTFTAADYGEHAFTFSLQTAGNQQIYASDSTGVNGLSAPIAVSPAALDHFAVAGPPNSASYYGFTVTATAKDAYNNTISDYNGTVHFTSSDSAAALPADYPYTPADLGTHTFSATLQTAGTQTIAVNDSANVAAAGTVSVQNLDYVPGLHFVITPSVATTTAGAPFDVTLTALDQDNNVAVHYDGTVSFATTDQGSGVVLPDDYVITSADAGVHTFASGVTLVTAGNQSLSVVDISSGGLSSTDIAVTPAAADAFTITGLPLTMTRGVAQTFAVTATDPYGNIATDYSGALHFTSSDSQAVLPPDTTLNAGAGSFQVVFGSLGDQSLTVADASNGTPSATQDGITVNPAPAVNLAVTGFPTSTTAGVAGTFTVTATDAYGYVATGYTGTIHFTSSDPLAVLPADIALDNGTGVFSATFKTADVQSLTATDIANTYLSNTEGDITVAPAAASTLLFTGFPATITAGAYRTVTVTAMDAYGNVAAGYTGTLHFTSSDAAALLPDDYTFTATDVGVHAFSVSLVTAGSQSLVVQDAENSLTGAQNAISVTPAEASNLVVTTYSASTTAGAVDNIILAAQDLYGDIATGYTGAVHFSSSDVQAGLPADYAFTAADAGVHTFAVVLKTAGSQTVSLEDVPGGLGSTLDMSVTAAAASQFVLAGFPSTTTAGVVQNLTLTALDAYGNVAIGYTGTVHLTSSDAQATLPTDYSFVAADAGVHSFAASLSTAGTQSLTATDTAAPALNASQTGISVVAGAVSQLTLTGYPATTAGVAQTFTVTATDVYGNLASSYTGTVHFTSSDPLAVLPADVALTGGAGSFSATLKTAGVQSLTATDTANASLSSTEDNIPVAPAAAATLVLAGFPTTSTAGASGTITVTALDAFGNLATGYTGAVHFSSSDAQAALPADYTFTPADAGAHSFSATLKTAGTQSLGVQDAPNNLAGAQAAISVTPAAANILVATYSATATAGAAQSITIAANDAYGNIATSYRGTVHFSSSDAQASLPADYTFTAADAGVHTVAVVLKTAGAQTVALQDAANGFAATANISVTAAAATQFVLTGFPSTTTAGTAQNLTLTALDTYGNVATGYTGTVHFSSSDAQAVLPADYSFSANDHGAHIFSASLRTAGTQSLTSTDTAAPAINASQTGISVVAGAMSKFTVSGYPATTAGVSHTFTVTATDAYGNRVSSYRGTVHFTASDSQAGLPANYTFTAGDNGVHTFAATLKTAGSQSLTATDTATSSITGTQSSIVVTAAAATHLAIAAPANATINVAFTITVTALDAYGNIATGYLGTIHFTSSDSKAILPSNYTFVAADGGVHSFTVTLKSKGTKSVTATDTQTSTIKGSASVIVS